MLPRETRAALSRRGKGSWADVNSTVLDPTAPCSFLNYRLCCPRYSATFPLQTATHLVASLATWPTCLLPPFTSSASVVVCRSRSKRSGRQERNRQRRQMAENGLKWLTVFWNFPAFKYLFPGGPIGFALEIHELGQCCLELWVCKCHVSHGQVGEICWWHKYASVWGRRDCGKLQMHHPNCLSPWAQWSVESLLAGWGGKGEKEN